MNDKAEARLDERVRDKIGQGLRQQFDAVLDEPLTPEMERLLRQVEQMEHLLREVEQMEREGFGD